MHFHLSKLTELSLCAFVILCLTTLMPRLDDYSFELSCEVLVII